MVEQLVLSPHTVNLPERRLRVGPGRRRTGLAALPLGTSPMSSQAATAPTTGRPARMSTDITVTRNPDRHRYDASARGTGIAGFIDYQETSELVVLTHTEVDPSFEGRGVGSALARAALDDIRERQLKALVICPFIIGWLRRHHEYVDVLYNAPPSRVGAEEPT